MCDFSIVNRVGIQSHRARMKSMEDRGSAYRNGDRMVHGMNNKVCDGTLVISVSFALEVRVIDALGG